MILRAWVVGVSLLVSSTFAHAAESSRTLKVMSFNTMCDICKGRRAYGKFRKRLDQIADTINRHDPDLISLQEIRTRNQIGRVMKRLEEKYTAVFARGFPLSYADPVLLIRKSRFKLRSQKGGWLGPNFPHFSFGWGLKTPRRIHSATIEDRETGEKLIFVGSHFDNSFKNKERSAKLLADWLSHSKIPVVFAADTNIKPDSVGYQTLVDSFRDTFQETVTEPRYYSNGPVQNSDGCNLSKGKTFPECRVDHVLLSKDAPWIVKSWGLDTYRYQARQAFSSDHRALIVELGSR